MAHEFFIEEKPVFKERVRFGIDKTQQDGILGKVTWAMDGSSALWAWQVVVVDISHSMEPAVTVREIT